MEAMRHETIQGSHPIIAATLFYGSISNGSGRCLSSLRRPELPLPAGEFIGVHGPGDVVTLRDIAAERGQHVPYLPGLDALGYDLAAEIVDEIDGGAHDQQRILAGRHVAHERLVDLDGLHRQFLQVAE